MTVAELKAHLDDFRKELSDHRDLWNNSLEDGPIAEYAVDNIDVCKSRRVGCCENWDCLGRISKIFIPLGFLLRWEWRGMFSTQL